MLTELISEDRKMVVIYNTWAEYDLFPGVSPLWFLKDQNPIIRKKNQHPALEDVKIDIPDAMF